MEITIATKTVKCDTGTTEQLARFLQSYYLEFVECLDKEGMKKLSLSNGHFSLPIAAWSNFGAGFSGHYDVTNWDSTYHHSYTPKAVQAINDFAHAWCDHQMSLREKDDPLIINYKPSDLEA